MLAAAPWTERATSAVDQVVGRAMLSASATREAVSEEALVRLIDETAQNQMPEFRPAIVDAAARFRRYTHGQLIEGDEPVPTTTEDALAWLVRMHEVRETLRRAEVFFRIVLPSMIVVVPRITPALVEAHDRFDARTAELVAVLRDATDAAEELIEFFTLVEARLAPEPVTAAVAEKVAELRARARTTGAPAFLGEPIFDD